MGSALSCHLTEVLGQQGWFRHNGGVRFFRGSQTPAKADLQAFCRSRSGVEGYFELATKFSPSTLLLVASDGESIRRQVPSVKWSQDFCKAERIPCYDARLVGYPQKFRDYNKNATSSAPSRPSSELGHIMILESIAGTDPLPDNPSTEELRALLKAARMKAHPDRNRGERTQWDRVEAAAQALGLI